jgi:hypothetical protein
MKEIRGKGGLAPLDRPPPAARKGLGADTAVSIERKVVSGHAYAILAPDNPEPGLVRIRQADDSSVDGVSDP